MAEPDALRRTLGLFGLTLYGVGVIVGAGIFVLVGEVVGLAGSAGWLAFLGASVAALPTGLSYAELSSRFPKSAGEAVFAERAFGRPAVSFLVGFLIVSSGVMSTAAVSHGFARYAKVFIGVDVPTWLLIVGFLAALTVVNDRGIRESTWLNITSTVLSVLALLVIAVAGAAAWGDAAPRLTSAVSEVPATALSASIAMAFYAFIGFEDMCNLAEETRDPSRTIPRAILLSLAISTTIYVLVTVTALSVATPAELAQHETPVAMVSQRVLPGLSPRWLAGIALLAVTNTALINLIMTSRVLYGMARSHWLPEALGTVTGKTQTPRTSILLAFVLALALALTGVLGVLAEATNVIILLAFAAVNLSLIAIRRRDVAPDEDAGKPFRVPLFVPVLGLGTTAVLLTQLSVGAYARAAILVALGVAVHLAVQKPKD